MHWQQSRARRKSMRTWSHVALSVGLALGAGCGLAPDGIEVAIGESTADIVGGTPTTGYPAVALLYSEFSETDGAQLCTGTLVTPRVILTAAHCVEFPDGAPRQYVAYFGSDVVSDADPQRIGAINVTSYAFHPDWDINNLEGGHDVGMVLLEQPADGIEPMLINHQPLDGHIGEQVHLVGWGRTNGDGEDFGIKREAMSALAGTDDLVMQYGSATANTCQGDSGGPNFMTIDGVEVIAGITSYGNVGCDQFGVGTRVDAFADSFIAQFVAANDPNGLPPSNGSAGAGSGNGQGTGDTAGGATPAAGQGSEPVSGGCSAGGDGAQTLVSLAFAALLLVMSQGGLRRVRARRVFRRG
jgi:V8-like Glu-specific endopeptidase